MPLENLLTLVEKLRERIDASWGCAQAKRSVDPLHAD